MIVKVDSGEVLIEVIIDKDGWVCLLKIVSVMELVLGYVVV